VETQTNSPNYQARFNMIEQQIRTWEVLDPAVLQLLHKIPREDFVPAGHEGIAFADLEIPIGHGQQMLSPKVEARITQSLNLKDTDKVLHIGTGTGYLTALLASLSQTVVTVEIFPELLAQAEKNIKAIGGRMLVIVGRAPVMEATLVQRLSENGFKEDVIFETSITELQHAEQGHTFTF